jgi:hypothetical protein
MVKRASRPVGVSETTCDVGENIEADRSLRRTSAQGRRSGILVKVYVSYTNVRLVSGGVTPVRRLLHANQPARRSSAREVVAKPPAPRSTSRSV